jgi:glutathione S-transferase
MNNALHITIGNKNYSSWSMRGWLAVKHSGLKYEEYQLPIFTSEFDQKITTISPTRLVPALKHGDAVVWDSLAIIDYCARLTPQKYWWPDANAAYGHARSISAEMHSGFQSIRTQMPMNLRKKWRGLAIKNNVADEIKRIQTIWTECKERSGQDGQFLFGHFSAADIMYAPIASRFHTYGIEVNDVSQQYITSILSHEHVKYWVEQAKTEDMVIEQHEVPKETKVIG